jgi:tryptophan synthase beta chain
MDVAAELGPDAVVLVCLSGRGDKDMATAATWFDLIDPETDIDADDDGRVTG